MAVVPEITLALQRLIEWLVAAPLLVVAAVYKLTLYQARRRLHDVAVGDAVSGVSRRGSLGYIFVGGNRRLAVTRALPHHHALPAREDRVVIPGEQHHRTRPVFVVSPRWSTTHWRGRFTAIAAIGSLGSGKTS